MSGWLKRNTGDIAALTVLASLVAVNQGYAFYEGWTARDRAKTEAATILGKEGFTAPERKAVIVMFNNATCAALTEANRLRAACEDISKIATPGEPFGHSEPSYKVWPEVTYFIAAQNLAWNDFSAVSAMVANDTDCGALNEKLADVCKGAKEAPIPPVTHDPVFIF